MHPVTLEAMSGVVSYKDAAADIALLEVEGQARGYQDDLCEDFEPESFTKDLIIAYSYQLPSGPQIYTHDVSYHGQNLDQIIIRHDKQGGYLQRGSSGGIVCMKRGDSYIPIGMMSAIMVDETDRARIAHMLNNDLTTYPLGIAVKLSECSQRAPQSAILCSK
ncbi:MAG: hypothetical protein UZ21_OP11001000487 [Microgenomates bacterium OLB22]|nr:MAG: hypothetical protein UZ21_OP11001000487 [Microgenomates bacterium OLB22]